MDESIKKEIIELLEIEILYGFENKEELFQNFSDLYYEVDLFDNAWLKSEISKRIEDQKASSNNWSRPTDFDRLVRSFDELIEWGIVALHKAGYTKQDGEGDCRDIIEELQKMGYNAKGYCYYHTQDLERVIDEPNMLYIGYDSVDGDDDKALEIAKKITSVLTKHGFRTNWNGSLNSRIEILDVYWKKAVDNVDYNYGRVIEIFAKSNSNPNKNSKPFWKFW